MQIQETISKIKSKTLHFNSPVQIPDLNSRLFPVFLYIYYAFRNNNQEFITTIFNFIKEKQDSALLYDFNEMLISHHDIKLLTTIEFSQINLQMLINKAFQQALDLDLLSNLEEILANNIQNFELTSDFLLKIASGSNYSLIPIILSNNITFSELSRNTSSFNKTLGMMETLNIYEHEKSKLDLGKIILFCFANEIEIQQILRIIESCSHINDLTGIDVLSEMQKYKEIKYLYEKNVPISLLTLRNAIKYCKYEFVFTVFMKNNWTITDIFKIQNLDTETHNENEADISKCEIIEQILINFEHDLSNITILLFLMRKLLGYFSLENSKKFIEISNSLIQIENIKSIQKHAFSYCLNPIQILVLIIELSKEISSTYPSLNIKSNELKTNILNIISLITPSFDSESEFRNILLSKDIENRELVSIIVQNELLELLDNPHIELLAHEIWYGPYFKGKWSCIFNESAIFELLKKGFISNHNHKNEINPFEYCSWKKGAFFRVLLSTIEYILICALLFSTYIGEHNTLQILLEVEVRFNATGQSDPVIWQEYANLMTEIVLYLHYQQILVIFIDFLLCKFFIERLFNYLKRHEISFNLSETILTLGYLIVVNVYLLKYVPYFDFSIWKITTPQEALKLGQFGHTTGATMTSGLIMLLAGLRALFSFRAYAVIGPFIQILITMFKTACAFIIFLFSLVFVFALAYSMLSTFQTYEETTIWKTLTKMFQTTTASYELDSSQSIEVEIFTIVSVLTFNIIMLNLFVGMLSDIYGKMSANSTAIYLYETLSKYEIYAPDKKYQFMVSSFCGLDILFTIVILPIYLFLNENQKVKINNILLKIEYTLAFIILISVYFICLLIMIPFCYLSQIIRKMRILLNTDKVLMKSFDLASFIIVGIFILLFYLLCDLYYFTVDSYSDMPENTAKNNISKSKILKTEFKEILLKWKSCIEWSKTRKNITSAEFVKKVLNECENPKLSINHSLFMKLGNIIDKFGNIKKPIHEIKNDIRKISIFMLFTHFTKNFFSDDDNNKILDYEKSYKILLGFYLFLKLKNRFNEHIIKGNTKKHVDLEKTYGKLNQISPSENMSSIINENTQNIGFPAKQFNANLIFQYKVSQYLSNIIQNNMNDTESKLKEIYEMQKTQIQIINDLKNTLLLNTEGQITEIKSQKEILYKTPNTIHVSENINKKQL